MAMAAQYLSENSIMLSIVCDSILLCSVFESSLLSSDCCKSVTLSITGAAAENWRGGIRYHDRYEATGKKQEGAPVYRKSDGGYLDRHSDGTWHANWRIGGRYYGLIKSVGTAGCPASNSQWQYVDNNGNWKLSGDITVQCSVNT